MSKKSILAIAGSIIVLFVLLFVVYRLTNNPNPTIYSQVNIIKPDDYIDWSPAKKNILVEYSDFECPGCKNFHNLINQMVASGSADSKIKNKVTLVYRNFPLNLVDTRLHPNSPIAAYAAEAAGKQGKFFEMADLLFNNQDNWSKLPNPKEYFIKLANQLKLDSTRFNTDIDSQSVKDKVRSDVDSGSSAQVAGTPTFFLNGQKLDNIANFDQFKNLLLTLK